MLFQINSIKLLLRQNTKSVYIRYCSTQQGNKHDCTQNVADKPVRVRFAPSPTGKQNAQNGLQPAKTLRLSLNEANNQFNTIKLVFV